MYVDFGFQRRFALMLMRLASFVKREETIANPAVSR